MSINNNNNNNNNVCLCGICETLLNKEDVIRYETVNIIMSINYNFSDFFVIQLYYDMSSRMNNDNETNYGSAIYNQFQFINFSKIMYLCKYILLITVYYIDNSRIRMEEYTITILIISLSRRIPT